MGSRKKLDEKQKDTLIGYLKTAGPKYNKYLLGKEFLIVCDDYSTHKIRFVKRKFNHLTGLNTSLNDNNFYNNCLKGIISKSAIEDFQHYDFKTLCKKCSRLAKIDLFLNAETNSTLFLENLHTNTADYPVAVNNVSLDVCVGFRGNLFECATLRTSANSFNADTSKRILCILSRNLSEKRFSNINYISNLKDIFENLLNIQNDISEIVLERFSYITDI